LQVYHRRNTEDQRRYKEEMAVYNLEHEEDIVTRQALAAYSEHQETQIALEYYRKHKQMGVVKETDERKPKKPRTPYLFYCDEYRPILLQKGVQPLDASRVMGENWKKLSPEAKKPYEEMSRKACEDHRNQVQLYEEEVRRDKEKREREALKFYKAQRKEKEAQDVLKEMERQEKLGEKQERYVEKGPKKAQKAQKVGPRQPVDAFTFYCIENQTLVEEEFPDMLAQEISEVLAERWAEATGEERSAYEEMEVNDQERYLDDLAAITGVVDSSVVAPTTSKSKKPAKDPNAPKRTASPFLFFCRENRPRIKERDPNMNPRDITSTLSKIWNEMTPTQKKVRQTPTTHFFVVVAVVVVVNIVCFFTPAQPFVDQSKDDKERYRVAKEEYEITHVAEEDDDEDEDSEEDE